MASLIVVNEDGNDIVKSEAQERKTPYSKVFNEFGNEIDSRLLQSLKTTSPIVSKFLQIDRLIVFNELQP